MSVVMPRETSIVSYRVRDLLLPLLTLLLFANLPSVASAQALTQNQGPNLGTWTIGPVDLQLNASGGAGSGTYVWSLVSGSLPPGVSIRTDVPSYYPPNSNAGLLGVATTPGTYNFTLRLSSGAAAPVDRAYTWTFSALTDSDDFTLPD